MRSHAYLVDHPLPGVPPPPEYPECIYDNGTLNLSCPDFSVDLVIMKQVQMTALKTTDLQDTRSLRTGLVCNSFCLVVCEGSQITLVTVAELESLLREMSMELQASNAALDQARPPSLTNSGGTQSTSHRSSPFTPADSPYTTHATPSSDNSSQRTSLSPEVGAFRTGSNLTPAHLDPL